MISNIERAIEKSIEEERNIAISNLEKAMEKKIDEERKKYDEERKKFVLGALKEGLDLKVVAKITGLDEQQIREIMEDN